MAPQCFLRITMAYLQPQWMSSLSATAGGTHIVGARDFQIINGGQTTASLSNTRHKDKADLEGIYVQMKLTEIDESDMDRSTELVRNISRSSNSQNKVTDADFFSTHPIPYTHGAAFPENFCSCRIWCAV